MFRLRGMDPVTFVRALAAGRRSVPSPTHVFLCVADHFEPDWHGAAPSLQEQRVDRWVQQYGPSTDGLSDSRGRPPQHTFFYPIECYNEGHVEKLASLVRLGLGDVEVHLHHDDDHPDSLRELLLKSVDCLHSRHGLLAKDADGRIRYGFIHGNWALDNSHPDGRWCGVNNELTILRETGCYADFTMPAAPHPAQTRTINSIYYAIDDPHRPKSHDTGISARRNHSPPADGLLMIQGPLLITQNKPWQKPKVENGNLIGTQPPTTDRVDDWLRAAVAVEGHQRWLFIKLHTHGAKEANSDVLLGPAMRQFHVSLREHAAERRYEYFYVTAREMAQLVVQAQQGLSVPEFDKLNWISRPTGNRS